MSMLRGDYYTIKSFSMAPGFAFLLLRLVLLSTIDLLLKSLSSDNALWCLLTRVAIPRCKSGGRLPLLAFETT